jgi:hypothetical protein
MSAQSTEHGTGPEEQIKAPELSIVPNIPETLTSSYDTEQTMEVILPGNTEAAKALVDWNREVLPMASSSTDVAHLIDDAFKQELLRYETTEGKGGQSKTEVIGMVPEAVQWYNEARKAQEALKSSEKVAVQSRIDEARDKAKAASTKQAKPVTPKPGDPGVNRIQDPHEAESAAYRSEASRKGAVTRRLNKEATIRDAELGADDFGGGGPMESPEVAAPSVNQESVTATEQFLGRTKSYEGSPDFMGAGPAAELGAADSIQPLRSREDHPATYMNSVEQSHEAALAMKPDTDTLLEVQAQDKQLQIAAERLKGVVELDTSQNLSPKIQELTLKADKAGEIAIKQYADNLGKTLVAALDKTGKSMVKNTLKGEQLNMVEDLRLALGAPLEPLFLDSDKKSFTQYFKSDLDRDILIAERYDRKTGRLVEMSVVRGEDLVKTNKKGEAKASKTLKAEMIKTHTETSYANPTEAASSDIRESKGDIAKAAAIMRRRGATGVDSASLQRTKKVKRREPWWTGLFSGGGGGN